MYIFTLQSTMPQLHTDHQHITVATTVDWMYAALGSVELTDIGNTGMFSYSRTM